MSGERIEKQIGPRRRSYREFTKRRKNRFLSDSEKKEAIIKSYNNKGPAVGRRAGTIVKLRFFRKNNDSSGKARAVELRQRQQ